MDLASERARWDLFFARTQIAPVSITYEELVADPDREVSRVAALMQVEEAHIRPEDIDLRVQRDELSGQWRERFVSEYGDRNVLDAVHVGQV